MSKHLRELFRAGVSPETCQFDWKKTRYLRENKSVTVNPFWVLWVVVHNLVEKNVGNWGQAHRSPRVARVRLEGCIDLLVEKLARFTGCAPIVCLERASKQSMAGQDGREKWMVG